MGADKNKDADGKFGPADEFEAHPEFTEQLLEMSNEFFKKNNPGFHVVMERLKNVDKAPA